MLQCLEYTIPTPGQNNGAEAMEELFNYVQARYERRDVRCANGTGYLDEHLADHCGVTWGIDEAGRPHITISYQKLARNTWLEGTVTLFRRYESQGSPWTMAVNRGGDHGLVASAVTAEEATRLLALVRTGCVEFEVPISRYELLH